MPPSIARMLPQRCDLYRPVREAAGVHFRLRVPSEPTATGLLCRVAEPSGEDMQLGGQPGADIVARVYFEADADVKRDDELDAPALGRVRVSHVVAPGGGHYLKALVSGAQTGR